MADTPEVTISLEDLNLHVPVSVTIGEFGAVQMGTMQIRGVDELKIDLADFFIEAARVLQRRACCEADESSPHVDIDDGGELP